MVEYSAKHWSAKSEKSAVRASESASKAEQYAQAGGLYGKITNCITEIPQDIKLELNNGTLTLKAGSKVYVPNGFEADGVTPKFDVVVIESDITISGAGTGVVNNFLFYRNSTTLDYKQILNCNSGTSDSQSNGTAYYDTTQNKLHCYTANGAKTQDSFPLCSFTLSNGIVTSIDQIFNGLGYIGSTVFALPNVKGLIPNGRNADGTLKNIGFVTSRVSLRILAYSARVVFMDSSGFLGERPAYYEVDNYSDMIAKNIGGLYYVKADNACYSWAGGSGSMYSGYVPIAFTTASSSGAITSLNPKQPFHAVDYQDAAFKQNFQVVSTLPSSPQPDVFYFIPE